MNRHCSKDIVTSIVYTYNHVKYFCINILFVKGVCMFNGIAEHEVAERKVAERDCFLRNCLFFCLFLFNLFLFYGLIHKC